MKGELIFIIGKIGSGKTMLINSLLDETVQKDGSKIVINGEISFCPQKAFIFSKSITENILFYKKQNNERLMKVVQMADLVEDLNQFDDGLNKLLNENGMNISGGQRMRINLARAFYKDSDIYLLDDPFSSLDIHVSQRIIENAILKELKGKTRIIVTHSIQYLKYADRVMYMDNGRIKFFDKFKKFQDTDYFDELRKTIHHESQEEKEEHKYQENVYSKLINIEVKTKKSLINDNLKQNLYLKYFIKEDKFEGRQIKLLFSLLFKYYGGVLVFILLISFSFLLNYLSYYANVYLLNFIDNYEKHKNDLNKVLLNYALIQILPTIISLCRILIITFFQVKTSANIHNEMMFRSLHGDLLNFYDKIQTGRLLNRFSKDLSTLDQNFAWNYNGFLLYTSLVMIDFYVTIKQISILVLLFVLLYIGIAYYYQNIFIKINKDIYRLESITKTPVINLTNEIISGRQLIKAFNVENQVIQEISKKINENTKNTIFLKSLQSWLEIRLAIFNIFIVQIATFTMFLIIIGNNFNSGEILISLQYIFFMINDLNVFIGGLNELETSGVSLERCDAFRLIPFEKKYYNIKEEQQYAKDNLDKDYSYFISKIKQNNVKERFTYEQINQYNFNKQIFTDGVIEFKNVYAKYPINEEMILKNISFIVKRGEKLGICGKTGSGKSTIIKLITQYLNQAQGQILIDEYQINKIDLKKLRNELMVVSQEVALFEGTLKENLNPKYIKQRVDEKNQKQKNKENNNSNLEVPLLISDEEFEIEQEFEAEIIDYLKKFGFSQEKINKFGLNFKITNGGTNLSQGEQQLIAIFRVFFSNKNIIILDEATSSIDYKTEKNIMKYFYEKIKNKTVISIAHRINTILKCDKIMVLDQGQIVEFGNLKDLLSKQDSLFKKMYDKINQSLIHKNNNQLQLQIYLYQLNYKFSKFWRTTQIIQYLLKQ